MKRNLLNELKEGINALSERRNVMNEKDFNDLIASVKEAGAILRNEKCKNMTKVYIVTKQDFDTGSSIFCGVFFKRALAENWITLLRGYGEYRIETWQEQEDGAALEVYEI